MQKKLISALGMNLLSCVLLCAFTVQLFAQEGKAIDSLKKELKTQTDGNKLTQSYYELAKLYVLSNFDSAAFYYNKALMLAQNQEDTKLTTEILLNISKLQAKQSKFDIAETNCTKAIELARETENNRLLIEGNLLLAKIKVISSNFSEVLSILEPTLENAKELNDSLLISECYDAYGAYYYYSDIPQSIDYYIKSIRILEKYAESETLLSRVINVGSLYGRIGQNKQAIEYLLRGAEIAENTRQDYVMSTVYNNLAAIYFEMQEVEKSKYYLEEALKIARNLNDEPMICGIMVNIGELYQGEKKYDIALDYYEQGLNNPAINNIPDQKIYTLHNIATLYYDLGDYNAAVQYAENALSLARQYNITLHNVELYSILSKAYEKNQNYKKALENQKLYKAFNDSLFNLQSTEKIAEIQAKYDFDTAESENILLKKDNEIQALTIQKQKNRQYLLLIVLFFIFSAIVLAWFKIKRDRKTNLILSTKNAEIELKSKELEKANIAKDKFFSILAHDLRNPFNSILGSMDLLSNEYDVMSDDERRHFIHLIYKSAQSTNKLLANLLEWSQTQRGGVKLDKKNNNVAALIKESVNLHQNLATKKEISIDNHVQDNTIAFFDKRTITITINNLINNAIKFTPQKGNVTISAERVNGSVYIAIQDTGVGIPPHALKSLFKIEVAQSTPGTNSEPGTGLGLILCKEFVEKNNGSIHVNSEEGKGSCFKISLPAES